tara:strand:+ start:508 stop:750 length:243 start_codon:yes stop_codon:yes gene_type:complete
MLRRGELIKIIEKSLELKEGTIESDNKDWHELWDSLGHLSILIKLDNALNGKCSSIKELSTATSVDSIISILKENNLFAD